MDPVGCQQRNEHKLKRPEHHNPGPNAVWHADGYDKLKPYGFPIHGCIDSWSRKLLWLLVTRSNKSPNNIGSYFLDTVKTCSSCPHEPVTDLGTENKIMVSVETFFCDDGNAHTYRIYSPISRDPKLVTQNTDPLVTKKIQETLGYKPRPKN